MQIRDAQREVRSIYLGGFPGQLARREETAEVRPAPATG